MDAGIEVKVESDDEMEPYDGSYACLICTESVRGQPALVCSKCSWVGERRSPRYHETCLALESVEERSAAAGRPSCVWFSL